MNARIPSYRCQKRPNSSALAFVELNGRRHYLGRYDGPESKQRYHALLAKWAAEAATHRRADQKPNPKKTDRAIREHYDAGSYRRANSVCWPRSVEWAKYWPSRRSQAWAESSQTAWVAVGAIVVEDSGEGSDQAGVFFGELVELHDEIEHGSQGQDNG